MKQQAKNFEIIENYLNGLMDEQETRKFEYQLRSDPELAMEYARHMEILKALKDKEQIEIRYHLKRAWFDYKEKAESRGHVFRQRRFYWIAASLILLISISLLIIDLGNADSLLTRKLGILTDRRFSLTRDCAELYAVNPRADGFTLIQPADSAVFYIGQSINFQWDTDPGRAIFLDILDRKGDMVISFKKMPECQYEYLSLEDRGIYLYRFRDGKDILKLGVFYVR